MMGRLAWLGCVGFLCRDALPLFIWGALFFYLMRLGEGRKNGLLKGEEGGWAS